MESLYPFCHVASHQAHCRFQVSEPSGSSILIASLEGLSCSGGAKKSVLSPANSRLAAMLMSGEESHAKQTVRCVIKLQPINILTAQGLLMLLGSWILGVWKVLLIKQSCP